MSKAVRDKWKLKKWYQVQTPPLFANMILGVTPADDPDKLIGRVIETSLFDITGDLTYAHVKLYFQIVKVEGQVALTRFKGHELQRDYLRNLTRRRSSKVAAIFDVFTKDGYGLRLTTIAWTRFKCKTSQKKAIRRAMRELLVERIKEMTLDELIPAMIYGDKEGSLPQQAEAAARRIYPLRKVEIAKSKLLWVPGPNGPEKAVVISPIERRAA
ncbi:MAG: 30S ribosomal protein S3ae [Acidilobaceae archaeon]|nr:30S ribosomal protein S3ae [Acidilobaceae archaeon]